MCSVVESPAAASRRVTRLQALHEGEEAGCGPTLHAEVLPAQRRELEHSQDHGHDRDGGVRVNLHGRTTARECAVGGGGEGASLRHGRCGTSAQHLQQRQQPRDDAGLAKQRYAVTL